MAATSNCVPAAASSRTRCRNSSWRKRAPRRVDWCAPSRQPVSDPRVHGMLGSWVDGEPGATLPIDDRGLHYGDGVFETILVRKGVPRFLGTHLERLHRGLATLAIDFPAGDALRA